MVLSDAGVTLTELNPSVVLFGALPSSESVAWLSRLSLLSKFAACVCLSVGTGEYAGEEEAAHGCQSRERQY